MSYNLQNDIDTLTDLPEEVHEILQRSTYDWLKYGDVDELLGYLLVLTYSVEPVDLYERGLFLYHTHMEFDTLNWGAASDKKTKEEVPLYYEKNFITLGSTGRYEKRIYKLAAEFHGSVLVHYRMIDLTELAPQEDSSGEDTENSEAPGDDSIGSNSDSDSDSSDGSDSSSSDSDDAPDGDDPPDGYAPDGGAPPDGDAPRDGDDRPDGEEGRMTKILSGLRSQGEDGKQVEALTQLCEMLSIASEDSLTTFSVDSFVPLLVGLLNHESNPDIMLLAARALTHLCDVLRSSCASVVHYGAVSCFVARLLTIEYMDLAEQSLQALRKISQEHPTSCLRAGALMAVLSYLDFFSTGVQCVALSTAANMCKKLPSDASDYVMEAVPLLTNLLQYHDSKVLEYASICLTRIAEAFASYLEKLEELCLVTQAASLISISNSGAGQASLGVSTYTGLIRLLSTCASGSPLGSRTLLLLGISSILKDILLGSGVSANASVSPALSRPADQIFEIVNLANELLPPLPEGLIPLPTSTNTLVKGSGQNTTSGEQEDALKISPREKLLGDQPELLQQIGLDLLPVLVQIYGSSVNGTIRHKCLSVIGKLMYFSTSEMIQSLIADTNISSFLAGVLAWKDPQVAEVLMEKLSETSSKVFVREGVVHAVDQLVLVGKPASHASPADKENDCVPGSARSRRYRRRSSNANSDGNQSEDLKNSTSVNIGANRNSLKSPTASLMLRETVSSCAKAFKEKHFPSNGGDLDVGVTDDLLHLKNLCTKLTARIDDHKVKGKGKAKASGPCLGDFSASQEEYLIGLISEILGELSKGDGVSTFEFIGDGNRKPEDGNYALDVLSRCLVGRDGAGKEKIMPVVPLKEEHDDDSSDFDSGLQEV